jgi:hypothetical protein
MFGISDLHSVAAAGNNLYLSPDTIMPLASILAAILGFLLLFWRVIVNFIKKLAGRGKGQQLAGDELVDPDAPVDPPDQS